MENYQYAIAESERQHFLCDGYQYCNIAHAQSCCLGWEKGITILKVQYVCWSVHTGWPKSKYPRVVVLMHLLGVEIDKQLSYAELCNCSHNEQVCWQANTRILTFGTSSIWSKFDTKGFLRTWNLTMNMQTLIFLPWLTDHHGATTTFIEYMFIMLWDFHLNPK